MQFADVRCRLLASRAARKVRTGTHFGISYNESTDGLPPVRLLDTNGRKVRIGER